MYVGKTGIVKIPSVGEHEKIIILSNGYIYYATESHWDKKKGRMVDNRVGIGKIAPEHPGMMFPGKRFKEFFEQSTVDNENSSFFEHYCSAKRKQAGMLDVMLSYAPFAVLEKTAELSGMLPALKQAIPRWWKEILLLPLMQLSPSNQQPNLFRDGPLIRGADLRSHPLTAPSAECTAT